MASNNRPIGRKVTIVYVNGDPKDSADLLRAIANELRPRDVEIRVELSTPEVHPPNFADEQLETKAKRRTARVLKRANAAPPATPDPKVARKKLVSRVERLARKGISIAAKVVPIAEKVANLVKKIHDKFWN